MIILILLLPQLKAMIRCLHNLQYVFYVHPSTRKKCTIDQIILQHNNTAMTSNAADEQHTRGWNELQSMIQGGRERHSCCEIDEHRMIILGGWDDDGNVLSSGFIYDVRTEHSTPLPNNMPEARHYFIALANERYMFVIGGANDEWEVLDTVFCLSLETYEWSTLAPMGTGRWYCAGVLLGDYLYIFGGYDGSDLGPVDRYSIVGNC